MHNVQRALVSTTSKTASLNNSSQLFIKGSSNTTNRSGQTFVIPFYHFGGRRHFNSLSGSSCAPDREKPASLLKKRLNSFMGVCLSTSSSTKSKMSSNNLQEFSANLSVDDLEPEKPVEIKLGDDGHQCLLVKDGKTGEVSAVSAKCTHYGAPLAKGSYSNGIMRCPWHGACFNVKTGDIEDFPGLDSLHKYDVKVDDEGEVKVYLNPATAKTGFRRIRDMGRRDPNNNKTIVVVGGGGAAATAVEALRQDSLFTGRLVMLTRENDLPYDRPKLSKALTADVSTLVLRSKDFYSSADIEVLTSSELTRINSTEKRVHFENLTSGVEQSLEYDKLLLATGSSPFIPEIEGFNQEMIGKKVFVLRTPGDAGTLGAKASGGDIAILGTSFIGTEVAASVVKKANSVTLIGMGSTPFEKPLGQPIGQFLKNLHEEKGVKFELNTTVEKITERPSDDRIDVTLANGKVLEGISALVLGVGVKPNTAFAEADSQTRFEKNQRGYLAVDEFFRTSIPDVFAAGDVVEFPLAVAGGLRSVIGHWQLAKAMGKSAALNMMETSDDGRKPFKSVPFFWTVQYGKSLRYAGYAGNYDDIVYDGEVTEGVFAAYYCQGENVTAVATLGKDPLAADFANLLMAGKSLKKSEVTENWKERLICDQ